MVPDGAELTGPLGWASRGFRGIMERGGLWGQETKQIPHCSYQEFSEKVESVVESVLGFVLNSMVQKEEV